MLQLKDIKKKYVTGDTTVEALKGINLEFRENEFVSILGQSGCGKTTLINLLMRFYNINSGEIKIDNINIDNINYGIIKAVEPYNMQVFIDVINCEDEIIVYVYIQSKMDVPAIFKNKIYDINECDYRTSLYRPFFKQHLLWYNFLKSYMKKKEESPP